ncbi:hypothetical protein SDC9_202392 [bioreactor metagenome]|uniref:Uncharacterized protein n=1 Tax=bioreactor metagenome TaxID=1076179 RepID=A0A645ITG7_9ZZZZ
MLRNLRFHLRNEVRQQNFALLSCAGVHIAGVFFTIRPHGRIPSLPEMVVQLCNAAGTGLAAVSMIGRKISHRFPFICVFFFLSVLHLSDTPVDAVRRLPLHIIRDMGVNIQRGGRRHMADDG